MITLYTPAPTRGRSPEERARILSKALKSQEPLPRWAASEALDLNIEGLLNLSPDQLTRIAKALKGRLQKDEMIKGGYEDVPMTRRRAQLLAEYADKLAEMLEAAPDDKDLAEWVQSKIDRAAAAIQSAYHYLDQEEDEDLEKAVGHKYTHRKLIGRDQKTGRARYRYYYAEHHGGGITSAKFEAGSAFKLTWKGRRGHFHIDRVEGDQVFITHDSRPDMEPVEIKADELRALLKKQHGKAEQKHVEKRRKEVEEIKRRGHKGGLGLALHRLRQAAAQAGVSLPEQYQRKPKKTRAKVAETAREVETPRDQLTSTAQQIIEEANQEHEERHDEHRVFRDFQLGEHTHTKTGQKLFTALQKERTDRDEYFRRVAIAKKHGGRYERRYVRGFVFKNAEDARNFALEVEGSAQPEESAETVTLHEDHPGKDNFETMPEGESAGTPKALLDDIRSEITLERFMREGRRREDTAEREVRKILNTLETLEQGLLNREYSTDTKRAKAQEILNRRLPKILKQVRRLVSSSLSIPQLSGGAGKRQWARYERAAGDIGRAQERVNEEYQRAVKELDKLKDRQPQPTTPREQRAETAQPQPTQSTKPELTPEQAAVSESPSFVNDLIFNKQGKLTRARNRNKIKGHSDNGARSVAGDLVAETMRAISPDLLNHTNKQRYENEANYEVTRILRASKGLTREEIAISIEAALKNVAQRTGVLRTQPTTDPSPARRALTETAREVTQGADNFETMPEVESAEDRTRKDLQSKQQALDLLRRSEQEDELKGRQRAKGSKASDTALMRAVREILKRPDPAQDLDERDRQRLRDSLFSLEEAQRPTKYMNAQRSKEARQRARATIKEILDQQVKLLSEALNPTPIPQAPAPEPTTPSTRPTNLHSRSIKGTVDQALSSEPTGISLTDARFVIPSKGDLREMLSQEQRLKRAKEDLRSTGAPNFLGERDPRGDIIYALGRYLDGPLVELGQARLRDMEREFKRSLRDARGEELEQVKDEIARFWREWGGEYKRLQSELVTERTQGEALRNIRPLIPKHALTPEINQLLDQMERELDQKPVTGEEVSNWIFRKDTNQATRDRQPKAQPTTPREQLIETAREVVQGADNFETMPEVEARDDLERYREIRAKTSKQVKQALRSLKTGAQADKLTSTGRRARASINADKKTIEAAQRLLDEAYSDMERPLPADINQRTPQQDNFAKLRGALSKLKSSQTLTRGSWTDDHESLKKKRIKARIEITTALKELSQITGSEEFDRVMEERKRRREEYPNTPRPVKREAEETGTKREQALDAIKEIRIYDQERLEGRTIREGESQFGRSGQDYRLVNRLRDIIQATSQGDAALERLSQDFIDAGSQNNERFGVNTKRVQVLRNIEDHLNKIEDPSPARQARRAQKSALHLIDYRASLLATVERLAS